MGRFHRARRASCAAVAAAAVLAVPVAGCGGAEEDHPNEPRPPQRILVSAAIGGDGVSVSPRSFGAGPITLMVANETQRSREVTLETDEPGGDEPGLRQSSGPINPGDTASLNADLRRGTYRLSVSGTGVDAVSITVGPPRESAQNELLLP